MAISAALNTPLARTSRSMDAGSSCFVRSRNVSVRFGLVNRRAPMLQSGSCRPAELFRLSGNFALALPTSAGPLSHSIEVTIDHRRNIESQHLAHDQSAHHCQAKRLTAG